MLRGRGAGAAVLAGIFLAGAPAGAADVEFDARWGSWVEIGGFYGTDESSYGELIAFVPLAQTPDSLVFTEIRGKYFEGDVLEGNAALGYRLMLPAGWNLGAWAGLDVRDTESNNTFGQASGGLEALSEHFDLRLNAYVPLTGPKAAEDGSAEVILSGANIFMIGGEEVALYGVDGEAGFRLNLDEGNQATLGVYGGGYWFDHKDAYEEIAGGKARAELAWNDIAGAGSRISAQYEFTYDDVRDERHFIGARLRIPLGSTPAASQVPAQWLRMADRLERDTEIVIGQSEEEPVEDALTNVDFDRVAYVNDGGSITDTSTTAGDNSLIIATGTVTGSQELQGNQTLQGGGSTIEVRGQSSGAVASFTAPGTTPTLQGLEEDVSILRFLGSNIHVAGLKIESTGPDNFQTNGIIGGSDRDNIVIEQTSLANVDGIGIFFGDGNSNVTIAGTTVANSDNGIIFGDENSNITITDATITDIIALGNGLGILFGDDNSGVTIRDTTVANTSSRGITFRSDNSDVTVSNVTITDAGGDGVDFDSNNSGVTISAVTITDAGGSGIAFNFGNSDVTISGTTVTNAGGDGIAFNDDNSDVTISDTTVTNAGVNGIVFADDNSDVTISGTTVTDTGDTGIAFGFGNGNVTISGTTVTNAGGDGIGFGSDNGNVTISGTTVTNADFAGIFFLANNNVALDDSTFAGVFGGNGIHIGGTGNTLNGAGNTAAEATFGGDLCQDNGNAWTGTIEFDGIGVSSVNCP